MVKRACLSKNKQNTIVHIKNQNYSQELIDLQWPGADLRLLIRQSIPSTFTRDKAFESSSVRQSCHEVINIGEK